jgi:uncharacterized protein with PQ loop repeat
MIIELFGILTLITGILMSLGHFMQAHKMYKRKSAKDISLGFVLIFTIGSYVWLTYSFLIENIILIISFLIASIGTTLLSILKITYDSKEPKINKTRKKEEKENKKNKRRKK